MSQSHDQNFKNLIVDYPLQSLAFFAPAEAADMPADPKVTFLRQELPKDRLGDRFFEMDVPLLLEWPDGRREALLFVIEEETRSDRFSIYRLATYCLILAESRKTDRVVPVVIFLRGGAGIRRGLRLGSELASYMDFRYIACVLPEIPVGEYLESDNIVARLNLVNMQLGHDQRVHAYGHAVRGLMTLERDFAKQLKYMDFVDGYCTLDDNEKQRYRELYTMEDQQMMSWSERARNEGVQQGVQQGMQRGVQQGRQEAKREMLAGLLAERFGELDDGVQARMMAADEDTLDRWTKRLLSAQSLEEALRQDQD